jgi:hypothetical protein
MTLKELEAIRDSIQAQLDGHLRTPAGPGQETIKHVNAIELLTAVRTVEQIIVQERAALAKPPGALGPTLVGV